MSVPLGDRNKSKAQFIETADKIEFRAMQVCRRWPKSWYFTITQRTVNLASAIYEHACGANAYFPIMSEQERMDRISELQKAISANRKFAKKIERAYSFFPLCGEKDKLSEAELADKSNRLFEEFMNLCLEEEEALIGNLHWTRKVEIGKGKED